MPLRIQFPGVRQAWRIGLHLAGAICVSVALTACQPSAATPTAAPSKPTEKPAEKAAPAGSPAASPVVPPAASPAASPAAAQAPASTAPQPVAKLADFPTRPIEIIVPTPPGGGFDLVSRQLAIPMQRELGQPVIVKNVPGGNFRIGARQFEQAPADGHTLMFVGDAGLYVSTFVEPAEGFDMLSWQWVANIRQLDRYITVGKDSPYNSVQDAVAANTAGQRTRMGHNGIAGFLGANAIVAEILGLKNVVHVGGFTGFADLGPVLIRGDIDLMVLGPVSSTVRVVESGDLKALAMLAPSRSSLLPNTPTARELNLPSPDELEALGGDTNGFAVVKGTSPERVRVLEQATLNALKDPEFVQWSRDTGVDRDLLPMTGQQTTEVKKREYALWLKYTDALKRAVQ